MKLLDIVDYDICNYKKPSMFLIFPYCTFKCGIENCQNYRLKDSNIIDMQNEEIISLYRSNPLTCSIVCGGLEPLDSLEELIEFIDEFRESCEDDIVIYTGYYKSEIQRKISILSKYKNIVVKYGRYIANDTSHYDDVLGVNLISNNQYAERIS